VLGRSKDRTAVVASLEFPPNVLKPRWLVVISQPSGDYDDQALEHSDGCSGGVGGDKKSKDEIVSPAFEVDVYDERDHPVKTFSEAFMLSSLASFPSSKRKSLCFGYLEQATSDHWKCSDGRHLKTQETRSKDVHLVQNSIDHLTTVGLFAAWISTSPSMVSLTRFIVVVNSLQCCCQEKT